MAHKGLAGLRQGTFDRVQRGAGFLASIAMQRPSPVIWSRHLRANPAVAGHNAIAAARLLAQRAAERAQAEQEQAGSVLPAQA